MGSRRFFIRLRWWPRWPLASDRRCPMRKLKKFMRSPGVFLRDYLNKRHPRILNEVDCKEEGERTLIEHNLDPDKGLPARFPIDVVYTWVDGADPEWRKRYESCKTGSTSTIPGGRDEARFRSHDELQYSVASVLKNMPWVRRIHIITDGQTPAWMKNCSVCDERIRIIDHRQIIADRYLPTFNSHVIEAHLHRVPDLGEHFIYFNDDVFPARPLPASHFFQSNGLASIFISSKSLAAMRSAGKYTPTLAACENSRQVLLDLHHADIDRPLVHTYVPLHRSIFERLWADPMCHSRIESFLENRTRGCNDLNLATFLAPWAAYFHGLAAPRIDICHYFNVRSAAAASRYEILLQKNKSQSQPHSICLNDFKSIDNAVDGYEVRLSKFLGTYFRSAVDQLKDAP